MSSEKIYFTELREAWARRRARVGGRCIDPRGASKPARDPDEAAFLKSIGRESVFTEVEMPGWKEWLHWRGTPSVAEARARVRAQPGFYASMGPDLREVLDQMEEPVISGSSRGG